MRKPSRYLILPIVSSVVPVLVYADESAFKLDLEEVIVTASRRTASVMDVPSNISVLSNEAMEKAGVKDFTKLTRNITGLAFSDTGPRNNGISGGLIMRGMNAQVGGFEDFYRSSDPAVSTYIDDVPLFVNLNLRDINRVEVLRGPQGTLYGSGSLGGTIRYLQHRANPEDFEGHVAASVAQTNNASRFDTDSEFMINQPVGDTFAVRIVGAYVDNAGFIDADRLEVLDSNQQPTGLTSSKKNINANTVKSARIAMLWNITDDWLLALNYQAQEDNVDGRQAYSQVLGAYTSGIKQLEPFSRDVDISSAEVQTDLGFASVTSSSSYYRNDAVSIYDQSYNYAAQGFWIYYAGVPREIVTGFKEYESDAFVQELRLVSNPDTSIDWVLGFYYSKLHGFSSAKDYIRGIDTFLSIQNPQEPDLDYTNIQKDTFEDKAVFGEISYAISPALQVTVGARFFDQTFESEQRITLPTCGSFCGTGPLGLSEGRAQQDFTDEVFKLNISYEWSEDILVFLGGAEGYRHGGSNGVPIDNPDTAVVEGGIFTNDVRLRIFEPDKATNIEFGFKGRFLNNHLEVSSALFAIEWDKSQVLQRSPEGSFPIVINLGESTVRGVECEIKTHFTENLSLILGYAYVSAEIAEDFNGLPELSGAPTLSIAKGSTLPGVAPHTLMASVDYTWRIAPGIESTFHLGAFYKESFATDFHENSQFYDEVDSQLMVDVSAGVSVGQWHGSVFIDNLLDSSDSTLELGDIFYQNYAGVPDVSQRLVAGDISYVVRPRSIGLGVKYQF